MPTLTLTSTPAMRAHLEKVAPLLARSASTAPLTRPAGAKPAPTPTPLVEPDQAARHARNERRNALFLRLRTLSPALFAANPPPPLKLNIHTDIVERLGLDAGAQRDLRCILATHTTCWGGYLKTLATPGAVRLDLDGHPTDPVSDGHRAEALHKLELLKAKAKAALKASMTPPPRTTTTTIRL